MDLVAVKLEFTWLVTSALLMMAERFGREDEQKENEAEIKPVIPF